MMNSTRRWFRPLRAMMLAGCLVASPAASITARAQAPAAEGEEKSEGRPLDGYLAMVMLASLAFLVVGKTARR